MRMAKIIVTYVALASFGILEPASAQRASLSTTGPDFVADQAAVEKAQADFDKAKAQFLKEGLSGQQPTADETATLNKLSDALEQAKKKRADDALAIASGNAPVSTEPTNCVIKSSAHKSFCIVTGPLVIPFRAQLSGKKDILGGFTAGGFLGFNAGNALANNSIIDPGFLSRLTLITFVSYSASFNSTNGAVGGTNTSGTTGVLSLGAGIAFPIQWDTGLNTSLTNHIGLVWGIDVTSTSNHYAYNGKSWISVVTGWSF